MSERPKQGTREADIDEFTMQPAQSDRPICPECGHQDHPGICERLGAGGSTIMFCDVCGLVWIACNVGTRYVGAIGLGRSVTLYQNRRLRVDAAGNLRLLALVIDHDERIHESCFAQRAKVGEVPDPPDCDGDGWYRCRECIRFKRSEGGHE